MNYMDDASTFERSLLQKARQKHIPVTGALELLPLCNMNCDMCYVRLSRSEMERQGRLRTVEEWVRLAEQMQKAGTCFSSSGPAGSRCSFRILKRCIAGFETWA